MSKNKKLTHPAKRPRWFKCLTTFLKLFIKKPKYIYLGEKIKPGSMILSNHVGAKGPLNLELYLDHPFRLWGTYEMNSNLKSVYKYLSEIYFHQKKHWNLTLARIVCVIAAPLLRLFYRGLNLISTYPDYRFRETLKVSLDAIKNNQSIALFPEDSSDGYHDKLKNFHRGFVVFADRCLKNGIDLPIYVAYLRKYDKRFIIDKPLYYSEILKEGLTKQEIADKLCVRMNELATFAFDENNNLITTEKGAEVMPVAASEEIESEDMGANEVQSPETEVNDVHINSEEKNERSEILTRLQNIKTEIKEIVHQKPVNELKN